MKKYRVTRTETWAWEEEFEAENEEELDKILDDYEWQIPHNAELDVDMKWEEIE